MCVYRQRSSLYIYCQTGPRSKEESDNIRTLFGFQANLPSNRAVPSYIETLPLCLFFVFYYFYSVLFFTSQALLVSTPKIQTCALKGDECQSLSTPPGTAGTLVRNGIGQGYPQVIPPKQWILVVVGLVRERSPESTRTHQPWQSTENNIESPPIHVGIPTKLQILEIG